MGASVTIVGRKHPENTVGPYEVRDVMSAKVTDGVGVLAQTPSKAVGSNIVIPVDVIDTEDSLVQLPNAVAPISVTPEPIVRLVKPAATLKALADMRVTLSGIVTVPTIPEQP